MMARFSSMVLGLLLLISCATWVSATNYTVGDSTGWGLRFNQSSWTRGKSFAVNDNLVFIYSTTQHNVEEVSESDYSACTSSNPINTHTDGNTTITLTVPGKRYFICGIADHCSRGMKVEVDVASASTTSPPPSSSNTTPPPPSPTTTNNNNSGAASLSPAHAVAVAFLGLVVLKLRLF